MTVLKKEKIKIYQFVNVNLRNWFMNISFNNNKNRKKNDWLLLSAKKRFKCINLRKCAKLILAVLNDAVKDVKKVKQASSATKL